MPSNDTDNHQPSTPFIHVDAADGLVKGSFALPDTTAAARFFAQYRGDRPSFPCSAGPRHFVADDLLAFKDARPFLSVVVRTQGTRIEELRDVFLCLSAQTDDDYEVLVIAHKTSAPDLDRLCGLIDEFPLALRSRISLYTVDYGNRTAPLQAGFSVARGTYVSALDDDDLVFDNWVETFHQLAARRNGAMLHSYVATQEWQRSPSPDGVLPYILRPASGFSSQYCRPFDIAAQLSYNSCPLMGLAFPAFVFQDLGLVFNDSLTTTEDWDYLLRVYSLCGVVSSPTVTAIYRIWTNAATSSTVHNATEWDNNYKVIVNNLNAHPYLIDTAGVDDIRKKNAVNRSSRSMLANTSELFLFEEELAPVSIWSAIATYNEPGNKVPERCTAVHAIEGSDDWDISFVMEKPVKAALLAYSPTPEAFKVLADYSMRVEYEDGSSERWDFANCSSINGYQVDCNHVVILKENSYVAFKPNPQKPIRRIDIACNLMSKVPDYYIDQTTMGKTGLMFGRASRWFKRKLHAKQH